MVFRKSSGISPKSKKGLPSLKNVVALHSVSLILTLLLGIILFLLQAPLTYYIMSLFLTGPIYAINIPYILRYIDTTEDHVNVKIKDLKTKVQTASNPRNNNASNNSKFIADQYAISKANSYMLEGKISKKGLIALSFTPIWPAVFYYTLYRISKKISIHKDLQEEINTILPDEKSNQEAANYGDRVFKTTHRHKVFFLAFSMISIFGFFSTFYLIGVGFFAPFWIILLHNRLSGYLGNKGDQVFPSKQRSERRYVTATMIFAFLCFGATAGFIASISNTIYASMISPIGLLSPTAFILFLVTFIAPLTEEPTKAAGFFLLDKNEAGKIPLFYWAFFGMIAGLGFALIENYSYFQQFFVVYSTRDSLYLLLMRFSMPVHLIGSALAGIGVGLWRKKGRLFYLLLFILLAMLVHGSYNFTVSIGGI